jgi:hypothetical protein
VAATDRRSRAVRGGPRMMAVPSGRSLRAQAGAGTWPNSSIEGTSTSRLRLLAAAPHVKR